MKLATPFGEIEIFIDNKEVEYDYIKIENDKTCENLNGRYLITIFFNPDRLEHKITCRIKNYKPSINDDIETGENLELKSFYSDNIKLSIGMVGNVRDERICSIFNYDNNYLEDGVEYIIFKTTNTNKYYFGIAWIENYTNENEVQTWYGADPTIIKDESEFDKS